MVFTCELTRQLPTSNGRVSTVGVDVGIRHLAVLSTGEQIPNPRPLKRLQRKRRRLQRQWNRQDCQRLALRANTRVAASSGPAAGSPRWKRGQPASAATGSTS